MKITVTVVFRDDTAVVHKECCDYPNVGSSWVTVYTKNLGRVQYPEAGVKEVKTEIK